MPPKNNDKGTPQGGVISPLLANLYLHWFDRKFHRKDGPKEWAKARLIRYADDFVVLARFQGERLRSWMEGQLEGWLGLQINREKTKTVQLKEEGATLTFLGYTFRYALDLHGRGHRYLTLHPSLKAMEKEREKIRDMTSAKHSHVPARKLINALNAHLKGWKGLLQGGALSASVPADVRFDEGSGVTPAPTLLRILVAACRPATLSLAVSG